MAKISGTTAPDGSYYSQESYKYTHLNSNAGTTIKSGPGTLHAISINTKGASANTCTVADATSGTSPAIAVFDTTVNVQTMFFDVEFNTGLTVTLATGTAADVTVAWK